jgi:hypothetical protein
MNHLHHVHLKVNACISAAETPPPSFVTMAPGDKQPISGAGAAQVK